jgi:DNA-3-methyladenine glycosylase II
MDIRPDIISHLKQDKQLAVLIDHCEIELHKSPMSVYDDLIRSVVSQQLSTSAAATIYGRFVASLTDSVPVHTQILNKSIEDLRSYGLSFQKAGYIQNITRHFIDNELFDYNWENHTDEEIISELSKIKGVGKWTVEMILMFSMYREDVLPLDDLIIRNHMISLYGVQSTGKQLIS